MPPKINRVIAAMHRREFTEALPSLIRRMDFVLSGRTTPSIDSMNIGAGKKVTAGVIFFDICGFTRLTASEDLETLKRTLLLLNCVIPAMMRVLYRYGAYVEKNTGDGLMAILGVETPDQVTANQALDIAEEMFYVLQTVVNPALADLGIAPVRARVGIDMGQMLISRIGLRSGSSDHERNSLTAVGPAANRACKLQGMAGVNEIWVGDSIARSSEQERLPLLDCVTPPDWNWNYGGNPRNRYHCWRYNGRTDDPLATILGGATRYVI